MAQAVLENDTAKLAAFLTDDYAFTVPEGNNISKNQFLLDMKKFWHPTSLKRTDQKVRINKNVAVITGLAESKWMQGKKEMVARERYTDTYILDSQKWELFGSQSCEEAVSDKLTFETELKNTATTLWKAWEIGDTTLAEPIYANEFIDIDFDGVRRNKKEVLAFLKPFPSTESVKIELSDWHFIIKNTTAVVNYMGEDLRTKEGKQTKIKFRATDTYIKRYGHWQIIAGQQVLIKN